MVLPYTGTAAKSSGISAAEPRRNRADVFACGLPPGAGAGSMKSPVKRRAAMKSPILIATVLALAGCDDPGFRGVPEVRTATAAEVGSCRLISHISMTPAVYGPVLAEQGVRYARNKVMESARADGANTVVFEQVEPGADVYVVRAQAYSC
jgi:hypothetical protein